MTNRLAAGKQCTKYHVPVECFSLVVNSLRNNKEHKKKHSHNKHNNENRKNAHHIEEIAHENEPSSSSLDSMESKHLTLYSTETVESVSLFTADKHLIVDNTCLLASKKHNQENK